MTKKVDWEKEFDKKFPYGGMIIEDDGSRYTFDGIKAFISSKINEAIAEEKERVLFRIKEYFRYIENGGVTGKPIRVPEDLIKRDVLKLIASK